MAIPTVDEVWADFNSNGSVKEPAKQDIRRLLRFIQAIAEANGMKTYPNKAAMDADTTQPDGKPALLYADPVEANNYPTVWIWDDAGNEWIDGVDRISSLKATVDLLNNVARRAVVLGGEIVIDRLGLYGGGTNVMYVPRNVFSDAPNMVVSNATIGTDSVEKPGSAKLAIPQGFRVFCYVDLTNNTFNVIQATGGDFAMPSLPVDKVIPIIIFAADGTYASPFRVRDLSPRTSAAAFLTTRPLVFSRSDNKVLIPSGVFRTSAGITTHTVAGGAAYEEFDISASGSNVITYWLRLSDNTYQATAGGAEPFTVDPTRGVVLGYSWGSEFWSPWPYVGVSSAGRGLNSFDKSKLPSQAPKVQVAGTAHIVAITEPNLLALGFTEGMANSHPTTGSIPAYGDNLPDTRWPNKAFARVFIQTTVADDFGTPRIWFVKEPDFGSANNSFPLSLEKKLSTTAAIYSAALSVPDPALATNPNGPWSFYYVGTGAVGVPDRHIVTGVQYASGPDIKWIDRNDFPATANNTKRIAALEAGQSVTDPAIALLYGPDMWTITGEEQHLYPDNINETRVDQQRFETALVSMTHTNVDVDDTASTFNMVAVDAYVRESVGGALPIDPAKLGDETYIMCRRWSDTGALPNRRYSRRGITVHRAPASVSSTKTLHMTGDSLTGPVTIKAQLKARLKRMGITANFVGTREYSVDKRVGNEGRGGWSFASLINAITLSPPSVPAGLTQPLAVGQEATYLAGDDNSTKITFNPYIRASTGGDAPGVIYNGYVFDFGFYLNRWSGTSLGALPTPDLVLLNFGTGDINLFAEPTTSEWVVKGLDIVVDSMLAAGVGNIGIVFPTFPHSSRNSVWPEQASVIRTLIDWHNTRNDPQVDLLPAWAHMSQNVGWPTNATDGSGGVVIDGETGAAVETITDQVHYYDDLTRTQINKVHAAWIACKIAGV